MLCSDCLMSFMLNLLVLNLTKSLGLSNSKDMQNDSFIILPLLKNIVPNLHYDFKQKSSRGPRTQYFGEKKRYINLFLTSGPALCSP